MVFPVIDFPTILPTGDDMADNYLPFPRFDGHSSSTFQDLLGYSRTDKVKRLVHGAVIDDGETKSIHLADDLTDYQNQTGGTVYAMITLTVSSPAGARSFKVWSAPTTDSKVGATEVFDSDDWVVGSWSAISDKLTTTILPISNNHFIVIENTTGVTSMPISVQNTETSIQAVVIEPGS